MLKWLKRKSADQAADTGSPAADPAPQQQLEPPQNVKKQGDEHVRAGRYGDAERCYRQVTESDAHYPAALVGLGFALKEQGRSNEAREVLERAASLVGEDPDVHYLLAGLVEAAGTRAAEISHLRKAIELRPGFELAHRQLIVALFKSERCAEAAKLCDESLAIFPDSGELHFYRSNLHLHAGDNASALASCRRALALNPDLIGAQQSLPRLLLATDQLEEAAAAYRREIARTPNHYGPYHQLGAVLSLLGKHEEAIEQFTRAISLNPQSAASYYSQASSYLKLPDETQGIALAQASLEKAVELEPQAANFHTELGFTYWHGVQLERARASFDRAIALDPDNAKARWARVMTWAPAFPANSVDDAANRSGFGAELAAFEDWWRKSPADGAQFVGYLMPFYFTYQEENNSELLKQYGRVCAAAMQRWLDREKAPASRRPLEKRIRLGVVSEDVRFHSVWMALTKGWLQSLDPNRFELVIFSLADSADAETSWAQTRADVFVGGPKDLRQWAAAIREQNCEILLYPAVGLAGVTLKLASLRLAPVQVNTWGHPDTSGLPTLDYYVSAECFEPPDAQAAYSERLVRLPQLGNRVQPMGLADSDLDFAALDVDLERPIFVCPGSPFKYQAAHDDVFVEIARKVPDAQFIFFRATTATSTSILEARLAKAFQAAGLEYSDHVRFIRWLHIREFHCLMRRADVMLDTIGFSGYNTVAQAMECSLPVVTREGRFLRGRLGSGVLRRMGLTELIVPTKAEYVELAARLVTDPDYQARIRDEIGQRRSVLFDDQSAMGPLQDFLESVARPDGAS